MYSLNKRIGSALFDVGVLTILAALLRWPALSTSPGWYPDEGTLLEIARHLAQGHIQYFGLNRSFLLAGRLILFPLLLAEIGRWVGFRIVVLRDLVVALSILLTLCLYIFARITTRDRWLALASALAMGVSPKIILYQRLGFGYHLGAALVMGGAIALWLYCEQDHRKWLLLSGVGIGLGSITEISMILFLIPFAILIAMKKRWQDLVWGIGLSLSPLLGYLLWLHETAGEAGIFDLRFILSRLAVPLPLQIANVVLNFSILSHDIWWGVAWLGLLLVPNQRFLRFVLIYWGLPFLGIARTAALAGLGYYYQTPVFPLLAIGIGSFFRFGFVLAEKYLQEILPGSHQALECAWRRWLRALLIAPVLFLVLSPFLLDASRAVALSMGYGHGTSMGIHPSLDQVLLNAQDAQRAIEYINRHVSPQDLVITSPTLGWAFISHTTDFQLAQAYQHHKTPHFPIDIPPDRFAFDPTYSKARYAVIDPVWRNWAAFQIQSVAKMTEDIRQHWVLEKQIGTIEIFVNPAFHKESGKSCSP